MYFFLKLLISSVLIQAAGLPTCIPNCPSSSSLSCMLASWHCGQHYCRVHCDTNLPSDELRHKRKDQKSEAHYINQKLLHAVTMINRFEHIYQGNLESPGHCVTSELQATLLNICFSQDTLLFYAFKCCIEKPYMAPKEVMGLKSKVRRTGKGPTCQLDCHTLWIQLPKIHSAAHQLPPHHPPHRQALPPIPADFHSSDRGHTSQQNRPYQSEQAIPVRRADTGHTSQKKRHRPHQLEQAQATLVRTGTGHTIQQMEIKEDIRR